MAAARPMAVANSASAIEGATTVRLVFFCAAIAWKAVMIPQTVPNRPMKGEAVATMASRLRPSSTRCASRAMTLSSTRSMRWIRKAVWASALPEVSRPLARASRHSRSAACSIRGRAWRGASPAAAAMSSSDRPDPTSSSNRLAKRFSAESRIALSMITVHDQIEAMASPASTTCTTMLACRTT